jgi:hypothetical protein
VLPLLVFTPPILLPQYILSLTLLLIRLPRPPLSSTKMGFVKFDVDAVY